LPYFFFAPKAAYYYITPLDRDVNETENEKRKTENMRNMWNLLNAEHETKAKAPKLQQKWSVWLSFHFRLTQRGLGTR
jgi:hypothetical protein